MIENERKLYKHNREHAPKMLFFSLLVTETATQEYFNAARNVLLEVREKRVKKIVEAGLRLSPSTGTVRRSRSKKSDDHHFHIIILVLVHILYTGARHTPHRNAAITFA